MVPNQVENDNRWSAAPAWAERTACDGDDSPAAAMNPRMASDRNAAVLCSRGCVQGAASFLALSSLPPIVDDDTGVAEKRVDFGTAAEDAPPGGSFATKLRLGCRLNAGLKKLTEQLVRSNNGRRIVRISLPQLTCVEEWSEVGNQDRRNVQW